MDEWRAARLLISVYAVVVAMEAASMRLEPRCMTAALVVDDA